MKLNQELPKINLPGKVSIIPEEEEDLSLLSNIISPGDVISAKTSRKIIGKNGKTPIRIHLDIEIRIKQLDYSKESSYLRASGTVTTSNCYFIAGVYHTLELVINDVFDLEKKNWDEKSILNLEDGCKNKSGCDLAVLMIDKQTAALYLVGKNTTKLCAKIDGLTGRKKVDNTKYFSVVMNVLMKNVDFSVVQCLMFAGPGTTKDEFKKYMFAQQVNVKNLGQVKYRVATVDVNSIKEEGLQSVLSSPKVINLIEDTKIGTELKGMQELNEMLTWAPDKACYGPKSVELADELGAIDTLFITDKLFRNSDDELRQKYIELMDSVKSKGGKGLVLSSMHISGKQLEQLTGVAAVLRFSVPYLADLEP